MITDAQLTFADNQALTATAASANQVDLTTARNLERSGARGLRIVALCTVASGGTSPTVQVVVRQSASAAMSSPDTLLTGAVIAAPIKGTVLLDAPMPSVPAGVTAKQFLDLNFVVGGTTPTMTVWAGIVMDSEGGVQSLGVTGR